MAKTRSVSFGLQRASGIWTMAVIPGAAAEWISVPPHLVLQAICLWPVTGIMTELMRLALLDRQPEDGIWIMEATQWSGCGVDTCTTFFGGPGDKPVTGDWNQDGTDEIGVFRPSHPQVVSG